MQKDFKRISHHIHISNPTNIKGLQIATSYKLQIDTLSTPPFLDAIEFSVSFRAQVTK